MERRLFSAEVHPQIQPLEITGQIANSHCLQVHMEHQFSYLKTLSCAMLISAVAFGAGYRSGTPGDLLEKLSTPRSGEREVLPPEALFVLDFTRQKSITAISLSKPLSNNRFLAQPITESIYPAVVKDSAAVHVSYATEPLPAGCESLQAEKGIRIASCR